MAKLYFYYAAMNAGKSTTLIQADFNYRERGMETMLYTAALDDRVAQGVIASRIGLQIGGNLYDRETDIRAEVEEELKKRKLHCLLLDEAQFLTRAQVVQLASIARNSNPRSRLRPSYCPGNLFEAGATARAAGTIVELRGRDCALGDQELRVTPTAGRSAGRVIEIGGKRPLRLAVRRHFRIGWPSVEASSPIALNRAAARRIERKTHSPYNDHSGSSFHVSPLFTDFALIA